ncbi:hypothetical protein Tco_0497562 [Tanacetum coccineum]
MRDQPMGYNLDGCLKDMERIIGSQGDEDVILILWDIYCSRKDLEDEATPSGEQSSPPVPKTLKQLDARRNQERIKSILLLAIPDEYLLKFHNVPDAKSFLKISVTESNETLDKAYDRFQKLISQLEIHGAYIDIDDIYNNLRAYEDEMKKSSTSSSSTQNLAFLSSENTNSTNEFSNASGDFGVSTAGGINQVPSTLSGYVDCQSKEVHSEDRKKYGLQRKNDMFLLISQRLSATTVTERTILLRELHLVVSKMVEGKAMTEVMILK